MSLAVRDDDDDGMGGISLDKWASCNNLDDRARVGGAKPNGKVLLGRFGSRVF